MNLPQQPAGLGIVWMAVLTVIGPATALADVRQAVPIEGEPFSAEIAAIAPSWQIRFTSNGNTRELSAADLVRWGTPRELRRGPVLVLADGGFFAAEVLKADKERLSADSAVFGMVEVPLELLRGIVFQLPLERQERDLLLDSILAAEGNSDEAILTNGDRIAGRFEGIGDSALQVQSNVGPVDVQRHRLSALVFNPSLVSRMPASGLRSPAGFADGSRLIARQLVFDEKTLKVATAGGLTWNTSPEDLVFLQPLGGRAMYLSDLKADGYRHVPFLGLPWPYRTDRNVIGGWLRAGDGIHAKGLGMHSASRITYAIDEDDARFEALLAVDDSTAGQGSVGFRVFVDGGVKSTSATIRGGDPPLPISVDIRGAKRLDLIVDFADRADVLDRADWLDARIVKEHSVSPRKPPPADSHF
ncbi:MAG: NPCBM/NEW2 domain-containing protein [Pirellulales bacterium]|nr:NPCBM/NEW2 domain-containing protein [Pirellulales bacterium]